MSTTASDESATKCVHCVWFDGAKHLRTSRRTETRRDSTVPLDDTKKKKYVQQTLEGSFVRPCGLSVEIIYAVAHKNMCAPGQCSDFLDRPETWTPCSQAVDVFGAILRDQKACPRIIDAIAAAEDLADAAAFCGGVTWWVHRMDDLLNDSCHEYFEEHLSKRRVLKGLPSSWFGARVELKVFEREMDATNWVLFGTDTLGKTIRKNCERCILPADYVPPQQRTEGFEHFTGCNCFDREPES